MCCLFFGWLFVQAKGDRSPQQHMIVKRTSGPGIDLQPASPSEGKSNSPDNPSANADASATAAAANGNNNAAKYGIIGTQVIVCDW